MIPALPHPFDDHNRLRAVQAVDCDKKQPNRHEHSQRCECSKMTSATTFSSFSRIMSLGPEHSPRASTTRLAFPKIIEAVGRKRNVNTQITSRLNRVMFKSDGYEDLTRMIFSEKQSVAFERSLKGPSGHTGGKNLDSVSYLPNSAIFRQQFSARAYEVGATGRVSFESLMNHLQETSINSIMAMGLEVDRMGSTLKMQKLNLIWVATKVQAVIDHYPSCDNVLQVENWIDMEGNDCMRRDAVIQDCKTGKTLVRTSSILATMNTETLTVGGIPEEVQKEVGCYLVDIPPIIEDDNKQPVKLDELTAGYICPDLRPRQSDLDTKQHVNNARYVDWLLESVPRLLLEDHELSHITMEYIKECHKDNVLKSMTTLSRSNGGGRFVAPVDVECSHVLKLENGQELMKARTKWTPKRVTNLVNVV